MNRRTIKISGELLNLVRDFSKREGRVLQRYIERAIETQLQKDGISVPVPNYERLKK